MLHVELRIKFDAKFVHKQGICLGFMVKKQGKKKQWFLEKLLMAEWM